MATIEANPHSTSGVESTHEARQDKDANEVATSSAMDIEDSEDELTSQTPPSAWQRFLSIILWTPPQARWNPSHPPQFSMSLNILFGFAGAFTVANLYYNHPILNILAHDFDVPYVRVSDIPTLAQAGYAVGLLFLCPLGDKLPRRPFTLGLMLLTATLTIPMAVTNKLEVFLAFQFITGMSTVTPQLMLPLVGDLAPPKRRAAALSIVVSGLMLGILIARLLSGIVTQFISWRYVYWISVILQYLIAALLWWFMPDYPATNPDLKYLKMLWSIAVMLTKHPVLVQACIISFFTSATFTGFWTVLTFLLSSPPYSYGPILIGLFALVGIASMIITPYYARHVIDRFVPAFSVVLGIFWALLGITIGTYTGTFTVAGPIIQAFFCDFGVQTAQIANRTAIFSVEPKGRNRVNTAFMVATFLGQLTGTTVCSQLYGRGGWVASGSYSVGSMGMALLVTLVRGPWEEGWVGWSGGWDVRKKSKESADGKVEEKAKGDVEAGSGNGKEGENVDAVNRQDADKSLELAAGEDDSPGDSEKGSTKSTSGNDDAITTVRREDR